MWEVLLVFVIKAVVIIAVFSICVDVLFRTFGNFYEEYLNRYFLMKLSAEMTGRQQKESEIHEAARSKN